MTVTDRTAATEQEFAARIAPFESAPTPPEVREAAVLEEVARAISGTRDSHSGSGFPCRCGWIAGFGEGWEKRLDHHRQLAAAAAAVAAYRATDGGAEEAVRRVEALADEFDEATVPALINEFDRGLVAGYARAAARIRAALAAVDAS